MMKQIEEAKREILKRCPSFPRGLIVLGSGLGSLLNEMEIENEISFDEIPHFKKATVAGHSGKLVVGKLGNARVACLQGRLHYYEGYSMQEVVFPFRVLAQTGAEVFFLTNAAGGVHPEMNPGDLMLVTDHLNCMGSNPLIGKNEDGLGPRFPDMSEVYNSELGKILLNIAKQQNLSLRKGVYAAVHGPSYETPAEVQMMKKLGADVIGMSTVPEAIALNHMGKKVVAVSCITNLAAGVSKSALDHEEVLVVAKKVQKSFGYLVKEFFNAINI